ncbi:hypothetical protein [Bradyrhizobium sp.]|uniref:hypothetical protein n=1 Tax=Bradyrhizobium sp. TaxID=376 RepID=UPI001D8E433E|nr:hypothetical protein [Bradyrhizobium sp.]MBV8699186.1 hypothetical protein [Bradyrhizobium sp.]MBV8920691.1 hypothetical protein [Bradyrhizobium sp.]MBV9978761.1 hypothetical protein [Bradyrhizobium sp.]
MSELKRGEVGGYGELVKRPLPDGLELFFIPSLAGMLWRAQQEKGAALTEDEVLQIRDSWGVMVMTHEHARAMEEKRGYVDIDGADAWQAGCGCRRIRRRRNSEAYCAEPSKRGGLSLANPP